MGTSVDATVGPLSVEMSPEGPIITHSATVPDGVTTQALIKGDGVQVHENDRVVAQFTVLGWTDGVVRVSTWETGVPQVINLSTAMRGLQTALVDQRSGRAWRSRSRRTWRPATTRCASSSIFSEPNRT